MICWPAEHALGEGTRYGLARFRETSAAQELAEDAHTWQLEASSWTDEFPVRLIWRDEDDEQVCFTMETPELWRITPYETERAEGDPSDPLSTSGYGEAAAFRTTTLPIE